MRGEERRQARAGGRSDGGGWRLQEGPGEGTWGSAGERAGGEDWRNADKLCGANRGKSWLEDRSLSDGCLFPQASGRFIVKVRCILECWC